jgi:hypothetical protein
MNIDDWITDNRLLPHADFADAWGSIVAVDDAKERLVNQALLALQTRGRLPFTTTSLCCMRS